MKLKLLFYFSFLYLFSCSPSQRIMIKYEDTNPVKIQEATIGLALDEFLPELDGSIAVKSIEEDLDNKLDAGVLYMIEDNLITSLLNNDYTVVDRDPQILEGIARESVDSSIIPSEYLLTYRVIECGVLYSELTKEDKLKYNISTYSTSEKIERSARTRLHCRLVNVNTNEIIKAGFVDNEVKDVIRRSDIEDLSSFTYSFYPHGLPLQDKIKSNENENKIKEAKVKKNKKEKKRKWWITIPLFLFLAADD